MLFSRVLHLKRVLNSNKTLDTGRRILLKKSPKSRFFFVLEGANSTMVFDLTCSKNVLQPSARFHFCFTRFLLLSFIHFFLSRCFPGWELPLPAASVSRAETSALDQQAAAMVDDLESSLPSSVRRPSSARGNPAEAFTGQEDGEGDDGGGVGGACGRGSGAEGQSKGLIEPSLLVAANAGLGASVPLTKLLPLWDYLLVRRDKHFG